MRSRQSEAASLARAHAIRFAIQAERARVVAAHGKAAWARRLEQEAIEFLAAHYPREVVEADLAADLALSPLPPEVRLEEIVAKQRLLKELGAEDALAVPA